MNLCTISVVLRDNPVELQRKLVELKSRYPDRGNAKGLFLQAKDVINDRTKSDTDRSCAFYVANKCSFSGLTESSSFSAQASDQTFNARHPETSGLFSVDQGLEDY